MHELRSKQFNLLFHCNAIKENCETSETSKKIVRSFISNKLRFFASNFSRIIFLNVHLLPGKASAIASTTSAVAPSIVKFLTMNDR